MEDVLTEERKSEIIQLAIDTFEGKVFNTITIDDEKIKEIDLKSIFMPILFMEKEQIEELVNGDIIAFYEYYSKSISSCNGYPSFASMRYIKKNELNIFRDTYNKLVQQRKELLSKEV